MNTLIAYASRYGTAEKCGHMLKEKLNGEVELVNLKKESSIDVEKFERVVIGGSFYIGRIQKEVKAFASENLDVLLTKKLALFACGVNKDRMIQQWALAFDQKLLEHAVIKQYCGYEISQAKLKFLDKIFFRVITKSKVDLSRIETNSIDEIARALS